MDDMKKGSWLDDDPEWRALKQRLDNKPAPKPKKQQPIARPQKLGDAVTHTPKPPKKVEVSLNLTVPTVKIPKLKTPKLTPKQYRVGATVTGFIVVSLIGFTVFSKLSSKKSDDGKGVLAQTAQKPEFDTVIPKDNEETNSKIRYDPERKVASFTDKIGATDITVSQQELPENLKKNTDEEVEKLAKGFSATEVIVESNPKAYLGTSAKGPQTVIFHKNGLLVFIFSQKSIEKSVWAEYITKLL